MNALPANLTILLHSVELYQPHTVKYEWNAGLAELADALDLGSSAQKAWEFDSPAQHHLSQ